jgi:phosphate-selective porin
MSRSCRAGTVVVGLAIAALLCLASPASAQSTAPDDVFAENPSSPLLEEAVATPDVAELAQGADISPEHTGELRLKTVFSNEQRAEIRQLLEEVRADEAKKAKAADARKKPGDDWYEVGSDPKLNANWNNGLFFTTAQKDWNIHFGGRMEFEPVFWNQPTALRGLPPGNSGIPASSPTGGVGDLQDGSFFRRMRLRSDGVAYETMEYTMEIDFEQLNLITFDHAWVGVKEVPVLGTIRVGQHKIPQGLEMMGSDYHLTFLERSSLADAFWTLFGQGIFNANTFFDQNVTYQTMFHRIQPNGFFTSDFGNGDYASSTRVTWTPYFEEEGRYLMHVGGSYQWRHADLGASILPGGTGNATADTQRVVRFRARPELRDSTGITFPFGNNARFIDTGFLFADSVQTLGPEFLAIWGPASIQAESTWSYVDDARSVYGPAGTTTTVSPMFWGGYVQGSYILTGENRRYDRRFGTFDRPKVRENFFVTRTKDGALISAPGAWEVAYRYSHVDLNDKGINGGLMGQHTLGLNWYLNDNAKLQFNYLNINRSVGPAVSGTVHGFGFMSQWFF